MDGHAIVTIEGIGDSKNLHPVQRRVAEYFGSQCGFCTPGIVMALYAFLRDNPYATKSDIEDCFDGNLCRCTGYRPILDAAKTFGVDYDPKDMENTKICPSSGLPCSCNRIETEDGPKIDFQGEGTEPIFPHTLKTYDFKSLEIHSKKYKCTWFRPNNYEDLLRLKDKYPNSKLVVGSTEITIEITLKRTKQPYEHIISTSQVPELNQISETEDYIAIGGSISLNDIRAYLNKRIHELPEYKTRTLRIIIEQLKWFAGQQIRNVASLAGNIATASPISDINPVLMAAEAYIDVQSQGGEIRSLTLDRNFFIAYRKTTLNPNDVIKTIYIPFSKKDEYFTCYKQSRRKEDDIAIVSGAFKTQVYKDEKGDYRFGAVRLVYGGMGPFTKCASIDIEKQIENSLFSDSTVESIYPLLEREFYLPDNVPGGMAKYRRSMCLAFLFKNYVQVQHQLGLEVENVYKSLAIEHKRPTSSGTQLFITNPEMKIVGQPEMHVSGYKQVTGEAKYVDDIHVSNCLFGVFVMSEHAHAEILNVDPSEALSMPGVVSYLDHKDLKDNQIGPVFKDEELLASKYVYSVGFPIGIIVAKDQKTAQQAAQKVKVEYKVLDSILSIEEAIEMKSFYDEMNSLTRGDMDKGFSESDRVIEGSLKIGGQEHFYLETQGSLVIPGEDDELTVIASTQNPTKTQLLVAKTLGVNANRVVCKLKRMGGGFGGKETRSIYVSCAAALAAHKLKSPVKMILDRDEDMLTSGMRHPYLIKYKVGFNNDGKINALDIVLYSNAGYSHDLSVQVGERSLFHVDNAYYIPNVKATCILCKTNLPTNTAFRGFGGPQAMIASETYINHIADTLGISSNTVREVNFYNEGDQTHYYQVLKNCYIRDVWSMLKEKSDIEQRQISIQKFNSKSRYLKRGLSCIPVKFGMSFTAKFMNQAGALVHIYQDGTVLVSHGGTEMGQGLHTKIQQIAAEALDIPFEDIYISETSTDKVANTSPTAASVQADLNGMAVYLACQDLNQKLTPLRERFPDKTLKELAFQAHLDRIDLTSHGFYATPDIGYDFKTHTGQPFAYFSYGAACCEVEVDCLTGNFEIIKTDIIMDVGKSLNPGIDIGQIEGAFAQGMGLTTMEEVVVDDRNTRTPGKIFTRGPSTYKIPGFKDIPLQLNVHLYPNSSNDGTIYSSKGIGEPPLFLGSSVYFAIKDAISTFRKESGQSDYFELESPATCEKIVLACDSRFKLILK